MHIAVKANNIDKYLVSLLHELGMSSSLNGYKYIKEAVLICLDDPKQSTVELYRTIADIFGTKPANVERGIRYAIEIGFSKGSQCLIESLFGYTIDENKGKTTNSEFIATLVERIQLDTK